MLNKSSLELSDIQIKVIEELDVLTDAFVSTFNRIGKTMKSFSEEISIIVDKFIKEKTNWRPYDTQCFDLSFIPFRSEYSVDKKFSINLLHQYFAVAGQKVLVKEIKIDNKKKQVDVLTISWGFKYDIEDVPIKFFYVEIEKDKSSEGAIFSKSEYEKLSNEIKTSVSMDENDYYDLEHPDDGDSESFYVWLDFRYRNKLSDFFQICKDELIEKFISKIKD